MKTKLKNIKYSRGAKVMAVIILWVSIMGLVGSGGFLISNAEMIQVDSYYNTREFQWEINELTHNVIELNTRLKDREQAQQKKTETGNGVEEYINEQEVAQNPETVTSNNPWEATRTATSEVAEEAVEDMKYPVDQMEATKEVDEEATLKENLARKSTISKNLSKAVNFNYYLIDLITGEISRSSSDLTLDMMKNHTYFLDLGEGSFPPYFSYYGDIEEMLISSPHEVFISVNEPLVPGDNLYDNYVRYSTVKAKVKEIEPYAMAVLIIGLILGIISCSYLIFVSGRRQKGGEVELATIDKIYNDVQIIILFFMAMVSVILVGSIHLTSSEYFESFFYYENFDIKVIVASTILSIDVLIGITYFFSLIRQYKKGVLIKNTLTFKVLRKVLRKAINFIRFIRSCFNEKIFKAWTIGLLLGYGLINGILFILTLFLTDNMGEVGLLFGSFSIIALNTVAVYFALKALRSLSKIMEAAKAISEGDLDYELDQSQMSMEFASFSKDIQSIQGGLRNAVNKAIQGERMKTELITNVSHDLKTPLTSIINYVDLLKQEDMDNEKAVGYLSILDEKSNRLKQLIEDLIEASKASTGNLNITTEQVDLHELIIQARGEYEEKIKEAQLDFRVNNSDEKISVLADGKYMWRIVENIMSNALKYSMANSRVYVNIEEKSGYGVLVMKNISSYPLDIDPEQLTERFTRGDESRSTEGSGLGLSIAQSLTDMQGGRFNVEIDGDLFKVTVEMPLWIEE